MQLVEVPRETVLYILDSGVSLDDEPPWRRLINVQYLGTKEVYLTGLEGGIDKKLFSLSVKWFHKRGIKRVRYRHKRKDVCIKG